MKTDILIVGSGFSGTIMALVLHKLGYSVQLIDRDRHPRFAIGESSTPYADLILRSLGRRYDLPLLRTLSRYGQWKEELPDIVGGSKQGFVYFPHGEHAPSPEFRWPGELVVASSQNRTDSDSNWQRSTVDHLLFQSCLQAGIRTAESCTVQSAVRTNDHWSLDLLYEDGTTDTTTATLLIDATGNGTLARNLLGIPEERESFRTASSAIFTHLDHLPLWERVLEESGIQTNHYPFPPDESALHHLTPSGWFWSLRFDSGRTSIGQLTDLHTHPHTHPSATLDRWIKNAFPPLLRTQLKSARLSPDPGKLVETGRLQRKLIRATGPGYIALPTTAGFVDPLHSTGLAWSLHGIEWIAKRMESGLLPESMYRDYETKIGLELDAMDLLVSTSYRTRMDPVLFELSTMLYFVASVAAEQARLQPAQEDNGFLSTLDPRLWRAIRTSADELRSYPLDRDPYQRDTLFPAWRARFAEWNRVGLFDASREGIYLHTAPAISDDS